MKFTLVTIFVIFLILVLIKNNSNNLSFMTNRENEQENIHESFNNPPDNFICEKDELACILSYQDYNPDCKNSFGEWKKFQEKNHGRKVNGKIIKVLAIDSTKNPNLMIAGEFDGPRVSLVSRYNIKNYDGRLNFKNLQKFLDESI